MKLSRNSFIRILYTSAVLVSFLFILSCKDEVKPVSSSGLLIFKSGNVSLKRTNGETIHPQIKENIFPGDTIITGKNSCAVFQLDNLGVFRVFEKTNLILSSKIMQGSIPSLNLPNGSVFSKIIKLKKKQRFSVKTPTSVAAVRGTEFMVSNQNNNSKTYVSKGKIELKLVPKKAQEEDAPEDKKSETKVLTAGKMAFINIKNKIKTRNLKKVEKLVLEKSSVWEYKKNIKKQKVEKIVKVNTANVKKEKVFEKKIITVQEAGLTPLQKLKKKGKVLTKLHLTDGSKLIGTVYAQDENVLKLDTGEGKIEIPKDSIIRRESLKK
jgi:hypothetical protein